MSASNDNRPRKKTYAVGYGQPPEAHRFQKGQSGNPNGRPRKDKGKSGSPLSTDIDTVIVLEAHRPIRLRENDQDIELSMMQAVMRSLGVAAVKGNVKAQLAYAALVQEAQTRAEAMRQELFSSAVTFKEKWGEDFARCDRQGLPRADPVPHPDDIGINAQNGLVIMNGPMTEDERVQWRENEQQRIAWDEEITYLTAELKKRKSPRAIEVLQGELKHATFMRDTFMFLSPDEATRRQPGFNIHAWRQQQPVLQIAKRSRRNRKRKSG